MTLTTMLWTPSGEPRRVPHNEVNTFIGPPHYYRSTPPHATGVEVAATIPINPQAAAPAEVGGIMAKARESADAVNINTATLKQLIALPLIGTALAKTIDAERKKQPFSNIEDLIHRVPLSDGNWQTIEHRLSFEVPADAAQ